MCNGKSKSDRSGKWDRVIIDKKWIRKSDSYTYINERIIKAEFKIPRGHFTGTEVYAPEGG
jgi:hypothetical protein